MLEPALLRGRPRYERVMQGWTDDAGGDALRHTVVLRDDDRALDLRRRHHIAGLRDLGHALPRAGRRRGRRGRGRRRAPGGGAHGGRVHSPGERGERAVATGPAACWQLDLAAWTDLADSCFTYSAGGRARLASRDVTTPMQADFYSPRPGQRRVFERRKVARLARTPPPYAGLCSEPQAKISALLGEAVDDGLRKRSGVLIGGTSGCAQLYDLTADLLKLLAT